MDAVNRASYVVLSRQSPETVITAVVFDMDGVLLDSEAAWDEAREAYTRESGGQWHDGAQRAMMGMSSLEWSRYLHDDLGVPAAPEEISRAVVERMEAGYREHLPLIPGAVEAVERIAGRWPLALASSANRPLIDLALKRVRARPALPGDRLVRGGRARQAGARRLPGGSPADRRRPGAGGRDRGLVERPALGPRGRACA